MKARTTANQRRVLLEMHVKGHRIFCRVQDGVVVGAWSWTDEYVLTAAGTAVAREVLANG